MIKSTVVLLAILFALFIVPNIAQASVYFSDDFNDNSFDTAKWTKEIASNGGPLGSINETGGQLVFNLQGGNPGGSAYAKSAVFNAGYNWADIEFSGQWGMSAYTAGTQLFIYNADDPTKYFEADYSPYFQTLWLYDSGNLGGSFYRTNSAATPFDIRFTQTGVEFLENGTRWGDFYSSTTMAGADDFFIRIGGGDYWVNGGDQYAYFDNIKVNGEEAQVVPEPATASLLGMGLLGLAGFIRRKRSI